MVRFAPVQAGRHGRRASARLPAPRVDADVQRSRPEGAGRNLPEARDGRPACTIWDTPPSS